MDPWYNDDMQEALMVLSLEKAGDEDVFQQMWRRLKLLRRKKIRDESEEDAGEYYNVSVYRILPYPPSTKNVKDFFIQRR
jgi:hypothetical protein